MVHADPRSSTSFIKGKVSTSMAVFSATAFCRARRSNAESSPLEMPWRCLKAMVRPR